LRGLAFILYKKEYFGFLDTAEKYVDEIENTMYSIPDLKHGKSKDPKVGKFFVRHKPNKKTTYYITFDCKGDRYYIEDIITNHEEDYKKVMGIV
jgi:hypothetical protein